VPAVATVSVCVNTSPKLSVREVTDTPIVGLVPCATGDSASKLGSVLQVPE
jgi:hypothetical protein